MKHNYYTIFIISFRTSLIIALAALTYDLISIKLEENNDDNIIVKHILHFFSVFIMDFILLLIFLHLFKFIF